MRLRGWIIAGAAFAGLGMLAAATSRKYHTRKIEAEREQNPAPKPRRGEPEGGWKARWSSRSDEAISVCRKSETVDSWRTAGLCAMDHAFPEGAPWTGDRASWPAWARTAQAEVDREIREHVIQAMGEWSPQHWQLDVWLRAHRLSSSTSAVDAARILWPLESWPPKAEDLPWKRSAWGVLNRRFASEPVVVA